MTSPISNFDFLVSFGETDVYTTLQSPYIIFNSENTMHLANMCIVVKSEIGHSKGLKAKKHINISRFLSSLFEQVISFVVEIKFATI